MEEVTRKMAQMGDYLKEHPNKRNPKGKQNREVPLAEAAYIHGQGYKLGRTIGEGSYSKVKTAVKFFNNGSCVKIACKMITKRNASHDFVHKFLPRELNIIRNIHHSNIIRVLDIFESAERVYIFMNLCEKGDLLDYIKRRGPLMEHKAKIFFGQIVSAVQYLHNREISHRDLKCENILISADENAVLGDFGFARNCRDPNTNKRILSKTFCGSAAYAAPEILQGTPYNPKMYDVWSLGCVLFIMLTGTMPFDDSDIKEMLQLQLSQTLSIPHHKIKPSAAKLIFHMLHPDIIGRATVSQIAHSPWFSDKAFPIFCSIPSRNYIAQR